MKLSIGMQLQEAVFLLGDWWVILICLRHLLSGMVMKGLVGTGLWRIIHGAKQSSKSRVTHQSQCILKALSSDPWEKGFTCFIHHGSCSCSDQCACLPPLQYVELKIWHPQVLERISKESIKSPACISKLDPSPNEHAMKVFNSAGTPFSDHACYFIAFLCSFLRC
nr:PREDICTED: uncharacterized protein LOC108951981 isoform X2 [Musa acuminata subsp. malaccensis]